MVFFFVASLLSLSFLGLSLLLPSPSLERFGERPSAESSKSKSSTSKAVPSAARSKAHTRSPVRTHVFVAMDKAAEPCDKFALSLTASVTDVEPTSNDLQPQYNASMTRVDVTSFSLKNLFTIPFKRTSAFSEASCVFSAKGRLFQKLRRFSHFSESLRKAMSFSLFSSRNLRQIPYNLERERGEYYCIDCYNVLFRVGARTRA